LKYNHLNYFTGGSASFIYCEKQSAVISYNQEFAEDHCSQCEMFNGSLQGEGIECLYEDPEGVGLHPPIIRVEAPEIFEAVRHKAKFGKKDPKLIINLPGKKQ